MGLLGGIKRWLLEVAALRPSGWIGRLLYGRLSGDEPMAVQVLEDLDLQADDRYLEVGQGGGRLMALALQTVGAAAGVDHSLEMARLAGRTNAEAVQAGRAHLVVGDAAALPCADASFTCCACVATFLFFLRPARTLAEMRRVLSPGGRLAILTPATEGGLARMFSRWPDDVRLYTAEQMEGLLHEAGFVGVSVEERKGRLFCYAETPAR